jgi:hypothetical protein
MAFFVANSYAVSFKSVAEGKESSLGCGVEFCYQSPVVVKDLEWNSSNTGCKDNKETVPKMMVMRG